MASIGRKISNDSEGKPMMVLFKKSNPEGPKAYIPLDGAWRFSEDHNPNFEEQMVRTVQAAYEHLGVGMGLMVSQKTQAREMAEIATVIEEGIDDLVKAEPANPSDPKSFDNEDYRKVSVNAN